MNIDDKYVHGIIIVINYHIIKYKWKLGLNWLMIVYFEIKIEIIINKK